MMINTHAPTTWLLLALLFILSGCQTATMLAFQIENSQAEYTWSNNKSFTQVPFTTINQHIVLPVSLNGSEPMRFVLDSGAAATVVTETARTKEMNLKLGSEIVISGSGADGDPKAYVVSNIDLAVGDFSIEGLNVIYANTNAMPFDSIQETYFDGVLGADFFNRAQIEINYDTMQVSFHKSNTSLIQTRRQQGWEAVPMEVSDNTPYFVSDVTTNNQLQRVKVMLDTGSTGHLSLFTGTLDDSFKPNYGYKSKSRGISGYSENHVALLDSMSLGHHTLSKVETYFRFNGENPQDEGHGVLGNRVLKQFNTLFDFENQLLLIKPNRNFEKGTDTHSLGLRLLPHEQGAIVKGIHDFSAASEVGLQEGHVVTHINNVAISYDNFDIALETLPDEPTSVLICWQPQSMCKSVPIVKKPFQI